MSYGRTIIYTDAVSITAENVVDEVQKAYATHCMNRSDISRLWGIYRGETRIRFKEKEIRPSINHKINENRAYEIVNFHKGYGFGEPIQYVRRENQNSIASDEEIASDLNALNGYMADANKAARDNELAQWFYVSGTSYRMTLPNPAWSKDGDEPPFKMYSLDPHNTFVVYSSSVDHAPLMGVCYVQRSDGQHVFSVYTENAYYEFCDGISGLYQKPHALGMLPIVEYPADTARLGVFEIVEDQLNALDELQSNRMDDIVQTVNSILAIFGAEMSEESREKIEAWKMAFFPEGSDAKYLSPSMSQADIQTLKDDLCQSILEICGMPNRNGGSSTSDTGAAVIMRDGWEDAEAKAKSTETMFKESEKQTLKLVLRILRDTVGTKLRLTDIETHFTRRNYANTVSKANVLVQMLNNPKIHPELAFTHCGMFVDPASAYLQSQKYYEEQQAKWEPVTVDEEEEDADVPAAG